MGPASARRLLDAMAAAADPLRAMHDFDPPAQATRHWAAWLTLHSTLRAGAWPDELDLVARWYQPHLERLHDDAPLRAGDLAQLARLAAQYPSRERFLAELTLDPPEATSDEPGVPHRDEDYLILSTLHSAKGQEWNAVYVLNVVDGCMPSDLATGSAAEIDEERRLLYVGMTRARHHLALLVPQRFHVTQQTKYGDRHLYGSLSRFVTPQMQALFDARSAEPAAGEPATTGFDGLPALDLHSRIRQSF